MKRPVREDNEKKARKLSSNEDSDDEKEEKQAKEMIDDRDNISETKDEPEISREELKNQMDRVEEKLDLILSNMDKKGGIQPSSKFTTDKLMTEKAGQAVLSELGKDIKEAVNENESIDKHDFKGILADHGYRPGSPNTTLSWMEKAANHFHMAKFVKGSFGGNSESSRIELDLE